MKKIIHVAVAIIHYGGKYLLGYRNASQHQGEKYEFIGGKIENFGEKNGETPCQALIREVAEEIGCDISQNLAIKMGIIRHDYSEKSVALHCFKVELNQNQFEHLQSGTGQEGQAITWVEKANLLAKKYPLPEANSCILDWLKLPEVIFISQPLEYDEEYSDIEMARGWLNLYDYILPKHSFFYPRLQSDPFIEAVLVNRLQEFRPDVQCFIPYRVWKYDTLDNAVFSLENRPIIHLNHQQLLEVRSEDLPKEFRYFASCHDKKSLSKVNQLAETHTVMGCFLSPVLPTPTHPESEGIGWKTFAELAEMADVPVFGLGGLGREDLVKVWENNGFGVAGIRLIRDF